MIDELDQKLILELQKAGRQTYVELAKMLGVTEGTIRNRVKDLLDKDIIEVTATAHLDKLGYDFVGIVGLQVRLADLRTVAEQLVKNPNVCYLANVTGRYDLIAIIVARSSREFADLMENTISAIPSILRTETFVTLHIYKGQEHALDTSGLITNFNVSLSGNS